MQRVIRVMFVTCFNAGNLDHHILDGETEDLGQGIYIRMVVMETCVFERKRVIVWFLPAFVSAAKSL